MTEAWIMPIFYSLAAVVIWQGVMSLIGGKRFLAYVRREMKRASGDHAPFASVIVPCRGLDHGLGDNLGALFRQNYPRYELIFVADDAHDEALTVARESIRSFTTDGQALQARLAGRNRRAGAKRTRSPRPSSVRRARIIIAGPAASCGQKVHNLLAAVKEADPRSEVFVFVDTDARPHANWLRALVAPLADQATGATTGYRWFVPVRGNFASELRAVWNASVASALGANVRRNFCWGGSMAIRRATFARAKVAAHWQGAASDDFAMTRALHEAGLGIRFVPACLVPSYEDCSWRELLEFTTRQMKITRVYAPHLWRLALVGNLLFVTVFFGGGVFAAVRAVRGASFIAILMANVVIFALGAAKAWLRLHAARMAGVRFSRRSVWSHLLLWPLTSALFLANAICAAWSRRLVWRGIEYELKSPAETVIINRSALNEG
ncbi:MAG: hypothetical protein C4334_07430 [Pyrinomonas sp.]|uniref:glycosyltransferase n=1 Tax=Pyrinomonas sp. TaxID=2080306 RepID=UPI0033197561